MILWGKGQRGLELWPSKNFLSLNWSSFAALHTLVLLWVKLPTFFPSHIGGPGGGWAMADCVLAHLCTRWRSVFKARLHRYNRELVRSAPGLHGPAHAFSLSRYFLWSWVSKSWREDSHSFVLGCYNEVTKERVLVWGCQLLLITTPQLIVGPARLSLLLCLAHIKKMNYSLVPLQKSIWCSTFQCRERRMG